MSANFGNYYNPNEVEANAGFEKLPDGEYSAIVKESEVVPTKDGSGQIFKATFEIIEGPCQGRTLINNYNIMNKNEQAAAIGRGQLKHLCEMCGKPHATDGAEIQNIPVVIVVGAQKNNPEYNDLKNVKKYMGVGASSNQASDPPAQQQATQGGGQQSQPSWMQGK
jgi:hypothetical protein